MSTEKTTNQAAFERAQRVIPGGVNSPVRAFRAVGGTPRFSPDTIWFQTGPDVGSLVQSSAGQNLIRC